MGRAKRVWYLSPMRAAKVQASLRVRAVSPEPPLLAHTSRKSRGTFRQKARSLAPLNGRACAVKICHDGMLEETNSLDGALICIDICISTHSNTVLPLLYQYYQVQWYIVLIDQFFLQRLSISFFRSLFSFPQFGILGIFIHSHVWACSVISALQ